MIRIRGDDVRPPRLPRRHMRGEECDLRGAAWYLGPLQCEGLRGSYRVTNQAKFVCGDYRTHLVTNSSGQSWVITLSTYTEGVTALADPGKTSGGWG